MPRAGARSRIRGGPRAARSVMLLAVVAVALAGVFASSYASHSPVLDRLETVDACASAQVAGSHVPFACAESSDRRNTAMSTGSDAGLQPGRSRALANLSGGLPLVEMATLSNPRIALQEPVRQRSGMVATVNSRLVNRGAKVAKRTPKVPRGSPAVRATVETDAATGMRVLLTTFWAAWSPPFSGGSWAGTAIADLTIEDDLNDLLSRSDREAEGAWSMRARLPGEGWTVRREHRAAGAKAALACRAAPRGPPPGGNTTRPESGAVVVSCVAGTSVGIAAPTRGSVVGGVRR